MSRDAALCSREAELIYQEAHHLRRKASLRRREEAQDRAEIMAFMDGDSSALWESLEDGPSEDESDLTSSISSSSTARTPPTPRNQPGPPSTPTNYRDPVSLGDTRVYEVSSSSGEGLIATW